METAQNSSKSYGWWAYWMFTVGGILMAFLSQDLNLAGGNLALAMAFHPLTDKSFRTFPTWQKLWIIGQMSIAIILMGFGFWQVIVD